MKVKNVMFAGFAAAILSGVCGAAEAAEAKILASKGFVETEIGKLDGKKQDVITDLETIRAQAGAALPAATAETTYATKSYVGTIPEGAGADNVVAYVEKKTEGIATEGAMTSLSGRVSAVENKVNSETDGLATKASQAALNELSEKVGTDSVATQIASELTKYETKANLEANYATKTELSGVETKANAALPKEEFDTFKTTVNAEAIAAAKQAGTDATDALDAYKEEMTTALAGKAAATDVQTLQQTVAGFTNDESGIAATYATKTALSGVEATANAALPKADFNQFTETNTAAINAAAKAGTDAAAAVDAKLEGYATDGELSALDARVVTNTNNITTLNSDASVEGSVKHTVESYGYQTAGQVNTLIGNATIAQAQVTGLTAALDGKQPAGNYQEAGNYLEEKMANNGSYLVTKTDAGVEYTAVQVVASDGTTNLLTGTELVTD